MEDLSKIGATSILHLPDDCLTIIFNGLDDCFDRESFGLTCRQWLHIQNFNRRSLQSVCSFTTVHPSPLLTKGLDIHTVQLHRLLRRFQQLEYLSICSCTELYDSGLTHLLSYGSNLQKLKLDGCLKVTNYGLSLVASGCPSLTTVSLQWCRNVTDEGLETLATTCLSLKIVNLSYCQQISDKGLKALTQRCHQLQAIKLSYCKSISGVGFEGCSKSLVHVEAQSCSLDPKGVMGIVSSGGVEYLDVSCLRWSPWGDPFCGIGFSSSLKTLNLQMCSTVSDASIVAIAKGCTLLEEWNLALCNEVGISGWQAVGLYCNNLKRLHVRRCHNLTDIGLQALRDGCKSLSILYFEDCVHVTPFALELFKLHRANVCIKKEGSMCIKPYSPFI